MRIGHDFYEKNFSVSFSELNFMIIKSDDQVPLYFLKKKFYQKASAFLCALGSGMSSDQLVY